jgi:hypothetical protein
MKTTRLIPLLIVLLLLAAVSSGQTADWSAVEQLNRGTPISVKLKLRLQCDFSYATETELVCEPRLQGRIPRGPIAFRRGAIRQVRIERVEASTVAGAVIGAGAGAAVGASSGNGSLTRGGGALLLGESAGSLEGSSKKDFPSCTARSYTRNLSPLDPSRPSRARNGGGP